MPVSVKGAVNLRKALRAYTPDLAKQMPKEIATALKPVVKVAKGYLPDNGSILSGWRSRENYTGKFPLYDASTARRGISYKTTLPESLRVKTKSADAFSFVPMKKIEAQLVMAF